MKKVILLLFILSSFILAKYERVYVALDPSKDIKSGNKLKVILVAVAKKGAKFKFPKITSIGEYKTINKPKGSVSYSIEQKGDKKVPMVKRTLTITIKPKKTFDMPSFTVKINRKKFSSIPFRVKVEDKSVKKGQDKKKKGDKKVDTKKDKDKKKKSNQKVDNKKEVKKSVQKKIEPTVKIKKPKESKKEKDTKKSSANKVDNKEVKKSNQTKNNQKEDSRVKTKSINSKKEPSKEPKAGLVKQDIHSSVTKDSKKLEAIPPKAYTPEVVDYIFKMSSNKKVVVEGEPFIVTVKLIEPIDLAGAKLSYTPPPFKNFKVVSLGDGKTIENQDSITRVIEYLLTPKDKGNYTIKPALANVEIELTSNTQSPFGFFGSEMQTKELKTNPLKVVVKPKPEGVDLVGKFLMKNRVDKLEAKANKPFNYFVVIHGFGDLDDFELPEFKIPGLTIYSEDSKLEHKIENGKLLTTYSKKFTFISDKDFEIPSIKLKVYNPKTGKIDIISTKSYRVKVKHSKSIAKALSGVSTEPIKVDKITESIAKAYEKNSTKNRQEEYFLKTQMLLFDKNYYKRKYAKDYYPFSALVGAIILGIIIGAGAVVLIPSIFRVQQFRTKEEALIKNYEDALNTLYPYTTTSKDIEEMVEKLYEVTNGNKDIVIDNYLLKKMLKRVKEKTI